MEKDTKSPQKLHHFFSFPIHTFLISIYPILYVYSRNLMNIPFRDSIRFLLISVLFFMFLLISFRIILKDWEKSGLLSSLIAALFFAFGHVANTIENLLNSLVNFNLTVLAWIWLAFFLITSNLIISKLLPPETTRFLNFFSLILAVFLVINITSVKDINSELTPEEKSDLAQIRGEAAAEASIKTIPDLNLPDIYYIILDGYLRNDYLKQYFDVDISTFLEDLQQRGFYVVSASRSNYLNTNYSLNSSLNFIYFHDYPKKIFNKSKFNYIINIFMIF